MFTCQPPCTPATACRPGRLLAVWCSIAVLAVLCLRPVVAQIDSTPAILRDKIEQLRRVKTLKIGEASVASTIVVPDFYEQGQFRLAWVKHSAIDDLFRAIRESEGDGLDPRDYHLV